jgi:hypothetical protein
MTVYFNQTLDIPYAGMILRRNPVNISILAGNDDIVLVLYDPSGSQYDFSIAAGQKILQRNFDLFRFEITGTGQAAVAISYPEVIEPSIEITLNPNLPQSVSSKQLPASLDSDGFFQIRYLGASDSPFRSWTLGASDVPNRGWNLGSSDVPGRGWTLGSSDTPDRSWTLGANDTLGGTISTKTAATPLTTTNTFTGAGGYTISPPSGYKWELRSIILYWVAENTTTVYPQVQIYPSSISSAANSLESSVLNLYFASLSVTASDYYAVDVSQYVQSRASQFIGSYYVSEQSVPSKFEIYSTETLGLRIGYEKATVNFAISYIEIPLG